MRGRRDRSWDPQYDSAWQLGRQHGFIQGTAFGAIIMLVLGVLGVLIIYTVIMNT